jgi:hypothetical protein
MYVRPARQTVAGASVGPDAGRLAGDHGLRAQCRELVRGFPWAWDEEVVAGAARLPVRWSARLAAGCPVGADATAEAALHQGVPRAAGPERESWGAWDAKAVEEQDAACRKLRMAQSQQGARQQARLALR